MAWQIVFFIIAGDPIRYRPIMLVAIVEKALFGLPAIVLFLTGRLHLQMLLAGLMDMSLGGTVRHGVRANGSREIAVGVT